MSTIALVGAQWGDEGKGKIIDILSLRSDMVVRAQGGDNAGHTVIVNDEVYKLHIIPSGILYHNTTCVVGNGVVINPKVILEEMDALTERGVSLENLKIDARAHVILPYHIFLDSLAEDARGKADIGTTKKGIGPCYMDKAERIGIRMYDLIHPEIFKSKLERNLTIKNAFIKRTYGAEPLDFETIYNQYTEYGKRLLPFVCDTSSLIYKAIKENKKVLFEGAQGALLDLDMGTYPFVTSSHPTSGGFCIGAGIGPTLIDKCLGIAKAYTTRVGKGPFPTELNNEIGEHIRKVGCEYGTTTGRPRRCGWLDLVILRFAVRVDGLTGIALNKLDTLSGLEKLKVCVSYKKGNDILYDFPPDINELAECEPVYEELDGWTENLCDVKTYDELPINAKKYIEFIEKNIDCPIKMIGIGPQRTQNLYKD